MSGGRNLNKYYCDRCKKELDHYNKRIVIFLRGCSHFKLCDECSEDLDRINEEIDEQYINSIMKWYKEKNENE